MKQQFSTAWGLGLLALLAVAAGCSDADKNEPRGAAEQLGRAWQTFRLTEYKTAVSQFEAVAEDSAPGSDERLQALYGLGCVWWLRQEGRSLDKARELFEQTITLAPESNIAGWSRLALARMQHLVPVGREVDYHAVRAAYQMVIDVHPDHPAAAEAFLYQQATHLIDGGKDELRTTLGKVRKRLVERPDDPFAGALHRLVAKCCEALGDPDGQLEGLIAARRVRKADPDTPNADASNTYWEIAVVAEFRAGRLDVAREYYRRLIDEYPTDMRGYSAEMALQRIADIQRRMSEEGTSLQEANQ